MLTIPCEADTGERGLATTAAGEAAAAGGKGARPCAKFNAAYVYIYIYIDTHTYILCI
jgi:hypothetical protein